MSTPHQLLREQRCWIHSGREAVARCVNCRRYYCRECITEHDGQMTCAECAARAAAKQAAPERSRAFAWAGFALGGLLAAWLVFYYLGMALARIPSDFHL